MIVQCAWCKAIQGEKPPLEDKSVSHGICLECSVKLMDEYPVAQSNPVGLENTVVFSAKV